MFVAGCWFRLDGLRPEDAGVHDRVTQNLGDELPATWTRHVLGGAGWAGMLAHATGSTWQWPLVQSSPGQLVLSFGVPVGVAKGTTPARLGRRVADDANALAGVVPPFGVLVWDQLAGRVTIQQDWLGMCRLFVATGDQLLALATRPTLLPAILGRSPVLSEDGWAGYAASGHFGGAYGPVRDVRLMEPGERLVLTRTPDGGWLPAQGRGRAVDDLVVAGVEAGAGGVLPETLAAGGLARVAASLTSLHPGELTLGLSGGKDSRVIAATLLSAGIVPRFQTNDTTPAEGEVARELICRLRERRSLVVRHTFAQAGAPAAVLRHPLEERCRLLQRRYDFQFPTTYLARPAVPARPPATMRPTSLTGAGGELVTGYWYPTDGGRPVSAPPPAWTRGALVEHLGARLAGCGHVEALRADVRDVLRQRAADLAARAAALGLGPLATLDYGYLTQRVRRWVTSAYTYGMITPMLCPELVEASFAMPAASKAARQLHRGLLAELAPEWADVPFVSVGTGPSRATQIWDGDGLATARTLLAGPRTALDELLDRDAVQHAVATAARGCATGREAKVIEQFVGLAVAGRTLGAPSPARLPRSRILVRLRGRR
jgi:asparagine synthase (glutamine-hydrolysing)